MKRYLKIIFNDGSEKLLEISKATRIRDNIGMLHLDLLKDNTYRLIFSEDVIDDFSKVNSLTVIRND